MWEYAAFIGVVFMTWYDNLWLLKLQQYSKRKSMAIFWEFMKWYSKRDKNEMIKDGYHVDSVYLYVHEPEYIKQYDMLRIFRDLIRDEIIKFDADFNVWDFVEACCDPDTNFDKVNKEYYHALEVNYTFDLKKYKMVYDTRENKIIKFPVYKEIGIRERDISKAGISCAFLTHFPKLEQEDPNAKDVTNELKKIAGPMQNFYSDTEYVVRKDWFLDAFLGVGKSFDSNEECYIHLIDFKGESHVITPQEKYLKV